MHNLVQNGAKYSPEGTQITIAGDYDDSHVRVWVRDEGIGIAPEDQTKIFDRFYRGDSALVRRTSGSGLGLSITKGHIEAHGGRVWLKSTQGQGSTFYIELPRDPVEALKEAQGV